VCLLIVMLFWLNYISGPILEYFNLCPFFSICKTSIVWSIEMYVCPVSSICCAHILHFVYLSYGLNVFLIAGFKCVSSLTYIFHRAFIVF
jgi:hypothetical protein